MCRWTQLPTLLILAYQVMGGYDSKWSSLMSPYIEFIQLLLIGTSLVLSYYLTVVDYGEKKEQDDEQYPITTTWTQWSSFVHLPTSLIFISQCSL